MKSKKRVRIEKLEDGKITTSDGYTGPASLCHPKASRIVKVEGERITTLDGYSGPASFHHLD